MKNIFRVIILAIAILFLALGINSKEYKKVRNKGNRVCLECVGIG